MLRAVSSYVPVFAQVWRLALPVIIANLLQSFVNVVDIFMAGRLGTLEIAAVGMSNAIRLLVFIGVLAVTSGSMALAAQAKGARDPQRLSFVARQSLLLTILLTIVLTPLGYYTAEPLLRFLNSNGEPLAVALGTGYLQILFLGTIFLMGNFVINSLMQGAGDTVTPLYLSGATNVLNIVFNYIFMFGFGPLPALGVAGAALGTITARFFGVMAGLYILYSGKNVVTILNGTYRPDLTMFKDILSIGIPSGLQGIVRNSAQLLVLRIVTSTSAGTFGAAALAIGLQVESLAFMPGLAISVAATSLVGQSLGSWQVRDAERNGNAAIILGILVMSIIAIPLVMFAPQIILLFDPNANYTVIQAGSSYIRINSVAQPILAIAMVTNGALRGAGDTTPGLIATILGRLVAVVPLAYYMALRLGYGVVGVWMALVVGTTVQALYEIWRWRSRRWQKVALRKSAIYRQHLHKLEPNMQFNYLKDIRAPIMREEGTLEQLDDEGVRYLCGGQEGRCVRIAFDERGYRVLEGAGYLPGLPVPISQLQPAYD